MNPTQQIYSDDDFEALARFAAQTRQQPQAQDGGDQNIGMLDRWASENVDLLSKVQTSGSKFTTAEQQTIKRWIGQDADLLRSLIPDEPLKASKPWLNGWQNWALITLTAGLIGYGVWERAIAFNASYPKPLENVAKNNPIKDVASKNIEVAPDYVPTDEALKEVIRTPTPPPEPIPVIGGNATIVVPSGFDSLTVRNSDGLGIGFVYPGDRVTVIKDDGGDRVTIKTANFTGSVVRRGIQED